MPNPPEMREIDPELVGNTLDLTRPELRPLLGRYVADPSEARGEGRRRVLIMGRPPAHMVLLEEAFREAGWSITMCPGPGRVNCPLLSGRGACPARCSSDVTVAYIDASTSHAGAVSMTKLRCAADGSSPGIVALEGRMDSPTRSDKTVIMGAVRSPAKIVTQATELADGAV